MGDSQNLDHRRKFPVDHSEGESLKQELAGVVSARRSSLRGLGNHADGPVEFGGKSRSYCMLRSKYHSKAASYSRLASSWTQLSCWACVSLEEIRARISSHGTVFALPESKSAMRRAISWFQAFSVASSQRDHDLFQLGGKIHKFSTTTSQPTGIR
jgi:hypothetical protein